MASLKISDIKRLSEKDSPYFFVPKTLRFFGQTMGSFKVKKLKEGYYLIKAPMKDRSGSHMGYTERVFEQSTGKLLRLSDFKL